MTTPDRHTATPLRAILSPITPCPGGCGAQVQLRQYAGEPKLFAIRDGRPQPGGHDDDFCQLRRQTRAGAP